MPERALGVPLFVEEVPEFTPHGNYIRVLVGPMPFCMPVEVFRLTTAAQQDLLNELDAAERNRVVPLRPRKPRDH